MTPTAIGAVVLILAPAATLAQGEAADAEPHDEPALGAPLPDVSAAPIGQGESATPPEDVNLGPVDDLGDDGFWNPEVVTPTGQPQRISETPSATFVITGEEIRRSGTQSIPEILRRVPGLEVRQLAASDTQVSARGFVLELSNRILVLVDGRTTAVDFLGSTVFEMLAISPLDIDRIEVVLGPGASLYGNKAMTATINIITRSAADYPRLEAQSGISSSGDLRGAVRWGGIVGPLRMRISGNLRRLTLFEPPPERDALDTAAGSLALAYSPDPSVEVAIEAGVASGRTHIIAVGPRVEPFRTTIGYLKVDGDKALGGPTATYGRLHLRMLLNSGSVRSKVFSCSTSTTNTCPFEARFDTPAMELAHTLRYEMAELPMQLRWGGELRLERLESTITRDERDIANVAGFISNEATLDRWRLTTGLRVDRQTFTDVSVSPRLSVVFAPTPRHQLRAAFNMGYNNPESVRFFADFEVGPGVRVVGSPQLHKEQLYHGEIGYSGTLHDTLRTFVNVFYYRMRNYVALTARPEDLLNGVIPFVNHDPLEAMGGEAGLHADLGRFVSTYLSYAYLRVRGRGDFPYTGHNLGSPEHKVSVGGRIEPYTGFYLTLDGQYFGPSQVDRLPNEPGACAPGCLPFEVTALDAFFVLHSRAGYVSDHGVEVSVAATNLTDDRTQQFPGGEHPRRRVMFMLGYYP